MHDFQRPDSGRTPTISGLRCFYCLTKSGSRVFTYCPFFLQQHWTSRSMSQISKDKSRGIDIRKSELLRFFVHQRDCLSPLSTSRVGFSPWSSATRAEAHRRLRSGICFFVRFLDTTHLRLLRGLVLFLILGPQPPDRCASKRLPIVPIATWCHRTTSALHGDR